MRNDKLFPHFDLEVTYAEKDSSSKDVLEVVISPQDCVKFEPILDFAHELLEFFIFQLFLTFCKHVKNT